MPALRPNFAGSSAIAGLLVGVMGMGLALDPAFAVPPPPPLPEEYALSPDRGDDVAMDIVEGLTTEVGPRQAGTEAEARARAWAVAKLKALGFANVRIEPYEMTTWVRGVERAEVISPYPQKLAITALGNSGSTGDKGLEGEIAYFRTLDALREAPAALVAGKIVFIDHAMTRTQDGSSYGPFGQARRAGPQLAAEKGAAAVMIRSIGTDGHRNPHTGGTAFKEGTAPIPAGAVSNPDADNIVRMLARKGNRPLRLRMLLTPRNIGMQQSGNVIAEIPGTDPTLPPILIACHLDSWDLGTGAFDDAAGCGIITAAARAATRQSKPKRTIRLLWAGAEEVGVWGGKAYATAYADKPHALAMEADFGGDRVWRVDFKMPAAAKPLQDAITARLGRMGIAASKVDAGGGADVDAIAKAQNLPLIDLQQDGTRYFDLHHTPDDTFDKIDPAQLRQAVAAWAAVLHILGNAGQDAFGATKP